jgi:two-component system nitrate/nitrite response regulator NarL
LIPLAADAAYVDGAMPSAQLPLPITVLLVDDQRAILAGVTALIEGESPRMQVTGQARCGRDALELAHDIQPDIIVLDADLAGEDGIALIPLLKTTCGAAIVVFTCLTEPAARHRALRLGAADFVPKTASGGDLIAAILAAIA